MIPQPDTRPTEAGDRVRVTVTRPDQHREQRDGTVEEVLSHTHDGVRVRTAYIALDDGGMSILEAGSVVRILTDDIDGFTITTAPAWAADLLDERPRPTPWCWQCDHGTASLILQHSESGEYVHACSGHADAHGRAEFALYLGRLLAHVGSWEVWQAAHAG
ncbi:hypothetical protein [Streptomyces sp. TR02-1]|uniref:hypothetical protein n=1 Tax=Streptomyces sp. TR02-1 TaxID=3385977 RepID=UPI0039A0F0ED